MTWSNFELECLLNKIFLHRHVKFLGVYAADELPNLNSSKTSYPCCYVVNTDPSSEPGEHWVAFYHETPHHPVEFFDSFGNPPSAYLFNREFTFFLHNEKRFQVYNSSVCGYYVVFYLYCRMKGQHDLHQLLGDKKRESDKFVKMYIDGLARVYNIEGSCRTYCLFNCLPTSLCCAGSCHKN